MRYLLDFLFPPRDDERTLRETSLEDFLSLVAPKIVGEMRPETVALFSFEEPVVRAAIHEAKYHGSTGAFSYLGTALADYLCSVDDVGFSKSHMSVVPIPLGQRRLRERGFNQVDEVVAYALRVLGAAVPLRNDRSLLARVRETVTQVSLARHEREKNMRGAFCVVGIVDPAVTYLVVDDVVTTGATLNAAVTTLARAGARHVIPLALAH